MLNFTVQLYRFLRDAGGIGEGESDVPGWLTICLSYLESKWSVYSVRTQIQDHLFQNVGDHLPRMSMDHL